MRLAIFAVTNQKGGVGKTTFSLNFAAWLVNRGTIGKTSRVLLLDADSQASATVWRGAREKDPPPFDVLPYPYPNLLEELTRARKGTGPWRDYEYIVIDTPPRISDIPTAAMLAADRVIIPVDPSALSAWATAEAVNLYRNVLVQNRRLKAAMVINQVRANTIVSRDIREALSTYKVRILDATIGNRVVFALTSAKLVSEINDEAGRTASAEIAAVAEEIMEGSPWREKITA